MQGRQFLKPALFLVLPQFLISGLCLGKGLTEPLIRCEVVLSSNEVAASREHLHQLHRGEARVHETLPEALEVLADDVPLQVL